MRLDAKQNLDIKSELNSDLIDKLFKSARGTLATGQLTTINFDKSGSKKEYQQLEKIRQETSANQPIICDKSRDIVRKSAKFSQPIFSDERYEAEINRYRTKRNLDVPSVEKSPLSKT